MSRREVASVPTSWCDRSLSSFAKLVVWRSGSLLQRQFPFVASGTASRAAKSTILQGYWLDRGVARSDRRVASALGQSEV